MKGRVIFYALKIQILLPYHCLSGLFPQTVRFGVLRLDGWHAPPSWDVWRAGGWHAVLGWKPAVLWAVCTGPSWSTVPFAARACGQHTAGLDQWHVRVGSWGAVSPVGGRLNVGAALIGDVARSWSSVLLDAGGMVRLGGGQSELGGRSPRLNGRHAASSLCSRA